MPERTSSPKPEVRGAGGGDQTGTDHILKGDTACCGAAEAAQMQQDPVRVCQSVGLWYVYLVRCLWCCAARSVPLMTQMTLRWNASTPLLEAARRRCQMFAFVLHVLPLGLRSEPMDSFQAGRDSNISLKLTPRRPPLLSEAIVPHCNTQK